MIIKPNSDLHIDFEDFIPNLQGIDVYVLAGDIGEFKNFMPWVYETLEANEHVHIVHIIGNHELYCSNIDVIQNKLFEFSKQHYRYHFLQNSSVLLNGINFIGATLWTDFNKHNPIDMSISLTYMSDYKRIKHKKGDVNSPISYPWRPQEAYIRHQQSRKYIFDELEKNKRKSIVVTHHKPYMSDNSPMFASYETDLDNEINICNNIPMYWIYGHTHKSDFTTIDYNNGSCTFVSNPRGYVFGNNVERTGFDKDLILEV